MNTWAEGVMQRLLTPGAILVIVGAAGALSSGWLSRLLNTRAPEKTDMIIKIVGCAAAVIGMILMFAS